MRDLRHGLIVESENTAVLAASPEPTLTLITCYPFYYIGPVRKGLSYGLGKFLGYPDHEPERVMISGQAGTCALARVSESVNFRGEQSH